VSRRYREIPIEVFEVPPEYHAILRKRVGPLIEHYGNNITAWNIEHFAWSCYTQGIDDAMQLFEKMERVIDFQI